jgi:hypothetical protein
MFQYCHLRIAQGEKWLNVTLLRPWMSLRFIGKVAFYQGYWRLGTNSVTSSVDDSRTIGSSIPMHGGEWEGKFWSYYPGTLAFREFSTWTDGTTEFRESLVLNNAAWTGRGVEPVDDSTATGTLMMGAGIFVRGKPLTWEYSWQ